MHMTVSVTKIVKIHQQAWQYFPECPRARGCGVSARIKHSIFFVSRERFFSRRELFFCFFSAISFSRKFLRQRSFLDFSGNSLAFMSSTMLGSLLSSGFVFRDFSSTFAPVDGFLFPGDTALFSKFLPSLEEEIVQRTWSSKVSWIKYSGVWFHWSLAMEKFVKFFDIHLCVLH